MEKELADMDALHSQAGIDDLMFRQVLAHSGSRTHVTFTEEAHKSKKKTNCSVEFAYQPRSYFTHECMYKIQETIGSVASHPFSFQVADW